MERISASYQAIVQEVKGDSPIKICKKLIALARSYFSSSEFSDVNVKHSYKNLMTSRWIVLPLLLSISVVIIFKIYNLIFVQQNLHNSAQSDLPNPNIPNHEVIRATPDDQGHEVVRTIPEVQGRENDDSQSVITGNVYIVCSAIGTGPIRNDRRFRFQEMLKTEEGHPFQITQDDFYVELKSDNKQLSQLPNEGFDTDRFYLPSTLFRGSENGSVVRFRYNDQLIQLTCLQSLHPSHEGQMPFNRYFDYLENSVRESHRQCLFDEDLADDSHIFQDHFVGSENYQLEIYEEGVTRSRYFEGFEIFIKDQEAANHGPYAVLTDYPMDDFNGWVFNLHKDFVQLSDIQLIESCGFNGLHQLWIIIPHKPENNQWPASVKGKMKCVYRNLERVTYTKETFNPSLGHRMPLYPYGQYRMITFNQPIKKIKFFGFNQEGYLTLMVV